MKRNLQLFGAALICAVLHGPITFAQGFNDGSDGSRGALNVTADTTLDLPPDGIFHFTTITIDAGVSLRFNRNALNTPVYLLATGDVLVSGTIDVSGSVVTGGPGGFDGGKPDGAGYGPGGGKPGVFSVGSDGAGGGSYSNVGSGASINNGGVYGSPLLVPLVGGSGGANGGGGGGGAILIASNTKIQISGKILARGGSGREFNSNGESKEVNGGSGGGIRLLAPVVAGNGPLDVNRGGGAGFGRVRIDTIDRTGIGFDVFSSRFSPSYSIGSFMTVFPPNNPRLDVIQAAGTVIAEGTSAPVTVTLPFGADPNRTIVVQARNFGVVLPINVVLTPDIGSSVTVAAMIDNTKANPATVTVPVTFPINTPVIVNAWTR